MGFQLAISDKPKSREGSCNASGRPSLTQQHQYEVEQADNEQNDQINIMIGGGRDIGLPLQTTKKREEYTTSPRDDQAKRLPEPEPRQLPRPSTSSRPGQKKLLQCKSSKSGVTAAGAAHLAMEKTGAGKRPHSQYKRDGSLTLTKQRASAGPAHGGGLQNRPRSAVHPAQAASKQGPSHLVRP